jgi:hypothetical protein
MPDLPEVYPTPLDLTRYTESTRRELYDRLVKIQTTPTPGEPPPAFDPEESGLTVFYLFGRWFAFWRDVPEPGLPEWRLTEMVRIQAAPDSPDGIILYEI